MFVPSMLLKQLYTFGSLKNTGEGVPFSISNRLSDVPVTGASTPNENGFVSIDAGEQATLTIVADGSTIVIGGLLQQSVQNVEDKTPVFGNLPVIGRLFQSKAHQPVSSALIFLVNVQLLDPTGRPFRQQQ